MAERIEALRQTGRRLVGFLSDDHDLALLRDRVLEVSKQSEEPKADEVLLALIEKRRAELQKEARFLGERIFAEKADAFESRFHEYWKAWRAEQEINVIGA